MGTELTNSTSWRMGGASASLACVVDSGVTSQKMREREKEVYEEEGGRVEGGGVRGGRREGRRMGNDGEERRRGEEELTSALQRA